MCVPICTGAHTGQKRASEPIQLELQVVVRLSKWVLGTELQYS